MGDDSTIVFTDINAALSTSEKEASKKPAALIVVGGDLNGTIFDLTEQETILGRSATATIPLDFQGISRNHCKINLEETKVLITDLESKNGTFVNNQKIEQPYELKKNDIIKIGGIAVKFIPQGDAERLTFDKLNQEAHCDGLTGCFNKAYFNHAIENETKKCKVSGDPLSLILIDLDHFKKVNDNYGHDAGDYVLKDLADLIRKNGIRDVDIFARYGGEEFVILLPKTNLKRSYEIAERLRQLVENHQFLYDQKRLPVTASIGVADYRQGVETGTDLFKRADSAVYKSKEGGRNQVNFYRG